MRLYVNLFDFTRNHSQTLNYFRSDRKNEKNRLKVEMFDFLFYSENQNPSIYTCNVYTFIHDERCMWNGEKSNGSILHNSELFCHWFRFSLGVKTIYVRWSVVLKRSENVSMWYLLVVSMSMWWMVYTFDDGLLKIM